MKLPVASFLLLISISSAALAESCESSNGIRTPTGRLVSTDCFDTQGRTLRQSLSLDGVKVLEDSRLSGDLAIDRSRKHWVYAGPTSTETGCPARLYLIDAGSKPARVVAFGVKNACNEFHWASWGEKRSVIALKHNVQFVYENGKLTPPASGEKLWKSVEPPHAGSGMAVDDAIPFAEEVPLPKP